MYGHISRILRTSTIRQSVVTVISTFSSAGLGAVFYLVLAREFGAQSYGLFSLCLTVMVTVSSFTDMGISTSLVRFVAAHRTDSQYFPYANLALRFKLLAGLVGAVILSLFARTIAISIFHQPDLVPYMPLISLGVVSLILFTFSTSIFQGLAKYLFWGSLQVGSNILRLMMLGAVIILGLGQNTSSSVIIFILPLLLGFAVSWFGFNYRLLFSPIPRRVFIEFWHFNKWTAAFIVVTSIVSRLDTLFAARYLDLTHVGIYSLALTMVSFLPQLSSAIGAVTSTKFAGFTSLSQNHLYLKKALPFSAGVSILVSLVMIPTALVVIKFTGRDYSAAMLPFLILLLSLLIFVITNPLRDTILYYFHQPQFFFWAGLGQGLVISLISVLVLPRMGITGSALSILGGHIFLCIVSTWYYLYKLHHAHVPA